jgi:hypothetical protein
MVFARSFSILGTNFKTIQTKSWTTWEAFALPWSELLPLVYGQKMSWPPWNVPHPLVYGQEMSWLSWNVPHPLIYGKKWVFLISNFRRVLNVVCFLLGNSPASEVYMPTFRNTVCSIFTGR